MGDENKPLDQDDIFLIGSIAKLAQNELNQIDQFTTDRSTRPANRIDIKEVLKGARNGRVDPAQKLVNERTIRTIVPDAPIPPGETSQSPAVPPQAVQPTNIVQQSLPEKIQVDNRQLEMPFEGITIAESSVQEKLSKFMKVAEEELRLIRQTLTKIEENTRTNATQKTTRSDSTSKRDKESIGEGAKSSATAAASHAPSRFPSN